VFSPGLGRQTAEAGFFLTVCVDPLGDSHLEEVCVAAGIKLIGAVELDAALSSRSVNSNDI
jgi:hypothetical protein